MDLAAAAPSRTTTKLHAPPVTRKVSVDGGSALVRGFFETREFEITDDASLHDIIRGELGQSIKDAKFRKDKRDGEEIFRYCKKGTSFSIFEYRLTPKFERSNFDLDGGSVSFTSREIGTIRGKLETSRPRRLTMREHLKKYGPERRARELPESAKTPEVEPTYEEHTYKFGPFWSVFQKLKCDVEGVEYVPPAKKQKEAKPEIVRDDEENLPSIAEIEANLRSRMRLRERGNIPNVPMAIRPNNAMNSFVL